MFFIDFTNFLGPVTDILSFYHSIQIVLEDFKSSFGNENFISSAIKLFLKNTKFLFRPFKLADKIFFLLTLIKKLTIHFLNVFFKVLDLGFHWQFLIFKWSDFMIKYKSEIFQMWIDISQLFYAFFLLLNDIFSLPKLFLHFNKSRISIKNFLLKLLLFLSKSELNILTINQFLIQSIFLPEQFLIRLIQLIEIILHRPNLVSELVPPLQQLFFVFLLTLLQGYIKLFSVSLHIVDQSHMVLLQVFILLPVLSLNLLECILILLKNQLKLSLISVFWLLIFLNKSIVLLICVLELTLIIIIDFS